MVVFLLLGRRDRKGGHHRWGRRGGFWFFVSSGFPRSSTSRRMDSLPRMGSRSLTFNPFASLGRRPVNNKTLRMSATSFMGIAAAKRRSIPRMVR